MATIASSSLGHVDFETGLLTSCLSAFSVDADGRHRMGRWETCVCLFAWQVSPLMADLEQLESELRAVLRALVSRLRTEFMNM